MRIDQKIKTRLDQETENDFVPHIFQLFSEKLSMNFVSIIGQLVLYSFIVGLLFWSLKYAVSMYVFSKKREEINRLEARISILKMHLKGKIKRKCNKIEDSLKKDADVLNDLRLKLNHMRDLTFASGGDYQTLISLLHSVTTRISEHIKLKHKALLKAQPLAAAELKKEEETQNTETDENRIKCKNLIKYDKAHVFIILEIIQTTEDLRLKIDDYNLLTEYERVQKKIPTKPESIVIENFEVLSELANAAKNGQDEPQDFQVLEESAA